MFPLPDLTLQRDLHLGFRFGVYFFAGGIAPNQLDIRFQRVKGLSASVKTTTVTEGGQNLYTQQLPTGVEHGNLILERGMVVSSPLNDEFDEALSRFKFLPSNVMVTLFSEAAAPVKAWMFMKAFPVKWSISDLDATEKSVLIDTLELAYAQMMPVRM